MRLVRVNPLVYPVGRKPGFDPTVATGAWSGPGPIFAAVCFSASPIVCVSQAAKPTVSGATALAYTIDPVIGPAVVGHAGGGETGVNSFAVGPATTYAAGTLAAILNVGASQSALTQPFAIGSGGGGPAIYIPTGLTATINMWGGANSVASVQLAAGSSYFLCLSFKNNAVHILALNLLTGAILSSTDTTGLTATASNGTFVVANNNQVSGGYSGSIAAVMFSPSFMTVAQMRAWARDPWALWFPREVAPASLLTTAAGGANAWSGQATFAGAGSLSARVQLAEAALATLPGTGSLSAAARQGMAALATLPGSGSLSATPALRAVGAVTLQGAGNLSALANLKAAASAILNGAGSLSALANKGGAVTAWPAQATLAGSGSLSATPRAQMRIAATLRGLGALQATPTAPVQAVFRPILRTLPPLVLFGPPSQSLFPGFLGFKQAAVAWSGQATFAGSGSLSAAVGLRVAASAILNGTGSLSALSTQATVWVAQATFAGAGNLSASTSLGQGAAAILAGLGNLSAQVGIKTGISAILSGAGSLSIDARITGAVNNWSGQATFLGAGSLSAATAQAAAALATLSGAGNLSATVAIAPKSAQAILAGLGSLSIDAQKVSGAITGATFGGAGGLSAAATQQTAALATLAGAGGFSVRVTAGYGAAVAFTGTGTLLASVAVGQAARVSLAGAGTLQVYSNLRVGVSARLAGAGLLSAQATVVPFGTNFIFPQVLAGQGGLICNAVIFGPRHVRSARSIGTGDPQSARRNPAAPERRNNRQVV